MKTLAQLTFSNRYSGLPASFYQQRHPGPLQGQTALVAVSSDAAALLDLDLCRQDQQQLLDLLTGHWLPPGASPLAMKYAGHQFGVYNPDLGDGRGLLLGEVVNCQGEYWDLHLKGAGQTAYSRFADGRAVLRSSIREFLGSEALHHLGIPTTRALAIAVSSEPVRRERYEAAATLLRLAPSHIRFGHFEHFCYQGDRTGLQVLLDFVINNLYPQLKDHPDPAAGLLAEVQSRTVRLVARWQAYGFCHGVLNTDNMSILGETFDFGPFAFLDHYEPGYVCNHSDDRGRYAFNRQPGIVHWNLVCLGQALLPLSDETSIRAVLERFADEYQQQYQQLMAARLGVDAIQDWPLVVRFLALCEAGAADWTRVLRLLAEGQLERAGRLMQGDRNQPLQEWSRWLQDWQQRVANHWPDAEVRRKQLCRVNPCVLPRTGMLQQAISLAESGDFSEVNRLLAVLRDPFDPDGKLPGDLAGPPAGAVSPVLSCSS
ncbi:protein adenylyltransferase SelO [Marinospirillum alkaliphilum]|uniref:Protein nucleotidyltransferase YdiU n=1 Tax=Marinospirillum alkaliphilum DSM 21637 TaxID=1122209 RepID=A0A1K1U0Z5_9GAMM|nr:YdiU family protein [Marinospirillum alkaliphilum]SFX06567.1 Uncharacterized conserved protein YdiU, UPF0061 family [Marinospirillum alkaliphilum DSM 21637]